MAETDFRDAIAPAQEMGGEGVTRDITAPTEPIETLLHEERIAPPQVGLYKVNVHHEFLRNWLQTTELGKSWTFDELWRVREECIAALAAPL